MIDRKILIPIFVILAVSNVTAQPTLEAKIEPSEINYYLISNTDHCLTDCSLKFAMRLTKDFTVSKESDLTTIFKKASENMDGVEEWGFRIGHIETYNTQVIDHYETEEIIIPPANKTDKETIIINEIPVYKNVTEEVIVWEDYNPLTKTIYKDEWVYIEVWGHKKPSLGENNVDAVPKIGGFELPYAWWNASWQYCRNITIDSDKIEANLTDFPNILMINDSIINYSHTLNHGEDIRIVNTYCNNSGSQSPHEIEIWNESGDSIIHHRVFNIDSTSDTIYSIYYGNLDATDGQNMTGVYPTTKYAVVYHLNDTHDSTDRLDINPRNTPATTTGFIDGAYDFEAGESDYFDTIDSVITEPDEITVCAWFKLESLAARTIVNNFHFSGGTYTGYLLKANTAAMQWAGGTSGEGNFISGGGTIGIGSWYYSCGRFNGTDNSIWLNNSSTMVSVAHETDGDGTLIYTGVSAGLRIGANEIPNEYADAIYDEIIVANVALSDAEIKAMYYSGKNELSTIGTETSYEIPPEPETDCTVSVSIILTDKSNDADLGVIISCNTTEV